MFNFLWSIQWGDYAIINCVMYFASLPFFFTVKHMEDPDTGPSVFIAGLFLTALGPITTIIAASVLFGLILKAIFCAKETGKDSGRVLSGPNQGIEEDGKDFIQSIKELRETGTNSDDNSRRRPPIKP